jgi:2-keto-4-pentenoate hydratase
MTPLMKRPWQDDRVRRGMEAMWALRRERLAAGDKHIGWKIAFGPKAVQEKLGITAPLVGFLTQSRVLRSGETANLAGWGKPIAEPEIAIHMARDLGAGADAETATAAIGQMGPSFELIDSPTPPTDPEAVLKGNIAHRHVIIGPTGMAALEQMTGRLYRGEAEIASAPNVMAAPGDPRTLIAYVAEYLAAFGETLRAGDLVICGSVTAPVPVETSDKTMRFVLDPLGEVSVRFSR